MLENPDIIPSKVPLFVGDLDPHLIIAPWTYLKSSMQSASRLVQSFFVGLMVVTDRQTHRQTLQLHM